MLANLLHRLAFDLTRDRFAAGSQQATNLQKVGSLKKTRRKLQKRRKKEEKKRKKITERKKEKKEEKKRRKKEEKKITEKKRKEEIKKSKLTQVTAINVSSFTSRKALSHSGTSSVRGSLYSQSSGSESFSTDDGSGASSL